MFQDGDKVVCIGMSDSYVNTLEVGKIYTVSLSPVTPRRGPRQNLGPNWICVAETNNIDCYEVHYFKKWYGPNLEREDIDV